jgi:hypothetical protein
MKVVIALSCLIFAAVTAGASEKARPCTRQDAIRAEKEASSLLSWAQVYKSYKEFSQCDDGAIAEGYSDSVARLLSDRWRGTGQLNRSISHDRDFEMFVLRHVDELMSPIQAENIVKNAKDFCPSSATRLCERIIARVKETGPDGR